MREKILITSALPYANGPLHFGHIAGAYLPADAYARFERLKGSDVLFISGSDEYGIAITLSADLAKRTPKEHVDIFHAVNRAFFEQLNISFDHYSRTTNKYHAAPVQQFFLDLLHNGFIEERVTEQLFSPSENRFLADRYVTGICPSCGFEAARGDECPKCGASFEATDLKNPRSKLTSSPLERRKTNHWFFTLDKLKDKILPWLEKKEWKPNVVNFVKSFANDLHPRAITRDSPWGIPVPLEHTEGKVLYVWFDAPIGYISATMEWAEKSGKSERWKEYWFDPKTRLVQFIGKDNIPFHAVIFPAMIMGQNQPYKLVDELPANEFYLLEGRQFSKSENWTIDLKRFFTRYTSDEIRYCIASNAPETSDSEFSWKDFQMRCNSELLGKYGNLVHRVFVFASKQCGGKVPQASPQEVDYEFLKKIDALVEETKNCYQTFRLRKACQLFMELAQIANGYFDKKQPWKASKDPSRLPEMETTIALSLHALKVLALLSYPVIPETAEKLFSLLGIKSRSWDEIIDLALPPGQPLKEPEILFRRVEDAEIEEELQLLKGRG